jgi:hypothetical protein
MKIGCLQIITAKNSFKNPYFEVYIQTAKIGCLRKFAKIVFCGIPIFTVNFAQTFLQCLPLLPHGVLGSNLTFEQNQNFEEFFAVYLKNRVFRPHHQSDDLKNFIFSWVSNEF